MRTWNLLKADILSRLQCKLGEAQINSELKVLVRNGQKTILLLKKPSAHPCFHLVTRHVACYQSTPLNIGLTVSWGFPYN